VDQLGHVVAGGDDDIELGIAAGLEFGGEGGIGIVIGLHHFAAAMGFVFLDQALADIILPVEQIEGFSGGLGPGGPIAMRPPRAAAIIEAARVSLRVDRGGIFMSASCCSVWSVAGAWHGAPFFLTVERVLQ
jgi:hypothetical protein